MVAAKTEVTVWVGDDPTEIRVHEVGSDGYSIIRFGDTDGSAVRFRPIHRLEMLVALRDKISAHINELRSKEP